LQLRERRSFQRFQDAPLGREGTGSGVALHPVLAIDGDSVSGPPQSLRHAEGLGQAQADHAELPRPALDGGGHQVVNPA